MRLALYQPEIPHNAGAIMRLAACLGVALDVIEPCGFSFADRHLRRVGLDYAALATVTRHRDWDAFDAARRAAGRRLILATRHATVAHTDWAFAATDVLLFGRESDGVPEAVRASAAVQVGVPIRAETRSLNLAVAAGMMAGEALRQTAGFPDPNAPATGAPSQEDA